MSSDSELERALQEARGMLPEPDAASTGRARQRALAAASRRKPRRLRIAGLAAAAVIVALALGVGLATFRPPSGEASKGPLTLGFLPEPGWHSLQAPTRWPSDQPAVAMAANVPFAREDVVNGLADASALPYSTLLTLPPGGVVVVATSIAAAGQPWSSTRYHPSRLPLRVRDATPYIEYGTQIRPDEPLAQYQLRALVRGQNIDLQIYVGARRLSPKLAADVQRQLDRLVFRQTRPTEPRIVRPAAASAPAAPSVLDRTFACTTSLVGGIRQIDTRAHRGSGRRGSSWNQPAFAGVETTVSGSAFTAIQDELVWVSAGRPSASATILTTLVGVTFPFRSWGTIGVNRERCRASNARVPLARTGLQGGVAGPTDDRWDCETGRRVLVRVRAVVGSPTTLRSFRSVLRTTVPVREATLAARTESGRQLVYAQVLQSGKSVLYTSPTCFPD